MALLFFMLLNISTMAQEQVYFQMQDPAGDERAEYPTAPFFSQGTGYFDLLHFQVTGGDDHLCFDFQFASVANPWQAPEGFSHQLVDLYLDTAPGGKTKTRHEGAGVRFAPEQGWEYQLRIMPWGGSALWNHQNQSWLVEVYVLPDGKTIRARVESELLGLPTDSWGYYVLVGSYDGFGPDNYRQIQPRPGPWQFGGRSGPAVIDLLALQGEGPQSQEAQLLEPAVLSPVGTRLNSRPRALIWFTVSLLFAFALLELYRLRLRNPPPQ